jgi:hypothetical protein
MAVVVALSGPTRHTQATETAGQTSWFSCGTD